MQMEPLQAINCFSHLTNHSTFSLTIPLGDQVFGVFILVTGCKQEQGSGWDNPFKDPKWTLPTLHSGHYIKMKMIHLIPKWPPCGKKWVEWKWGLKGQVSFSYCFAYILWQRKQAWNRQKMKLSYSYSTQTLPCLPASCASFSPCGGHFGIRCIHQDN